MRIMHQFLNSEYFFPNWKVETLFLGTFNPSCAEQLDYYYRRRLNGFWKIIKHYDTENTFNFQDFNNLKRFMVNKKFGCVDVIKSVTFPEEDKNKICGQGYTDDNLFKVNNYTREYNFDSIKNYVIEQNVKNIFTTWGKRCKPLEFGILLADLQNFCSINGIRFCQLKSPSGRLYRGNNIDTINNNWWTNLDPIFQGCSE